MPWNDTTGPVPRRSEAELLALARAKAQAARERSGRRLRSLSAVAAVILVLGLGTVMDRRGEDSTTQLRTTSGDLAQPPPFPSTTDGLTPSTVPSPVTSAVAPPPQATSTVPTPPTTRRATTSTSRPPATTPAPTPTTLACRNSYEAVCGPFRWDPPLPPNQPLTVKVSYVPATPKVGDTVTFTAVVDDPDGSRFLDRDGIANNYGDGIPDRGASGHVDCLERFGPWSAGAPEPIHAELTFRHVYTAAGTYTATFPFKSLGDCTFGPSEASGTATVTVAP